MKEESLLLLSDLQKLINQVVLIDYTIIILGGESVNVEKKIAKALSIALDHVLRVEANSTSCYLMFQPKAPKQLQNYRRTM